MTCFYRYILLGLVQSETASAEHLMVGRSDKSVANLKMKVMDRICSTKTCGKCAKAVSMQTYSAPSCIVVLAMKNCCSNNHMLFTAL